MDTVKELNKKRESLENQINEIDRVIEKTGALKVIINLRDMIEKLNEMHQDNDLKENLNDEAETLYQIMERIDKEQLHMMDVNGITEDDIINCDLF